MTHNAHSVTLWHFWYVTDDITLCCDVIHKGYKKDYAIQGRFSMVIWYLGNLSMVYSLSLVWKQTLTENLTSMLFVLLCIGLSSKSTNILGSTAILNSTIIPYHTSTISLEANHCWLLSNIITRFPSFKVIGIPTDGRWYHLSHMYRMYRISLILRIYKDSHRCT